MKISKGLFILVGIFLIPLFLLVNVQTSAANEGSINFPEREIRIVVAAAPGGKSDICCRIFAKRWEEVLGTKIMVENRMGAAGVIGGQYIASSKPDGYNLGWFSGRGCIPEIYAEALSYTSKDIEPLFQIIFGIVAFCVRADAPWADLNEFIAYAKDNPGFQYGHTGRGAGPHLQAEIFAKEAGIILKDVPFEGDAGSLIGLLSGDVDLAVFDFPVTVEQYKAGKIRILAVYSLERMNILPEVPTFIEQGIDLPLSVLSFNCIAVPAGVPEEVKNIIIETGRQVINDPQILAKLTEDLGYYVEFSTGDKFKAMLDEYKEVVGNFMKDLGLYQE